MMQMKILKKKLILKEKIKNKTTKEKIKKIKDNLNRLEIKIKFYKSKKNTKIELKNVSTGTSKINYIDPRITISFLKKNKIPIDKVFSEKLIKKFNWAFDIEKDFVF